MSFVSLQVEAGDVILKVNGTDVHRYSTKEGESSLKWSLECLEKFGFCSFKMFTPLNRSCHVRTETR